MKKTICLLLFFISFFATIFGQGWINYTPAQHEGKVLQTPDGGYAVLHFGAVMGAKRVSKYDQDGDWQWTKTVDSMNVSNHTTYNFQSTADGGFLAVFRKSNPSLISSDVVKINGNGEREWTYSSPDQYWWRAKELLDGSIIILGYEGFSIGIVVKITSTGNLIWKKTIPDVLGTPVWAADFYERGNKELEFLCYEPNSTSGPTAPIFQALRITDSLLNPLANDTWLAPKPYATTTSPTTIFENSRTYLISHDTILAYQWNQLNQKIPIKANVLATNLPWIRSIEPDFAGGFFVWFCETTGPSASGAVLKTTIFRYDYQGNKQWERSFDKTQAIFLGFDRCSDGGVILSGEGPAGTFLLHLDSLGNYSSNRILGQIRIDENLNCLTDSIEMPLKNWQVQVKTSQNDTIFATSDENGHYEIGVDFGQYEVWLTPPNGLWGGPCLAPQTVSFNGPSFSVAIVDFAVQALEDCPLMTVDLAVPNGWRRCFNNLTKIGWQNEGTVIAPDATVELTLAPDLDFISATPPPTNQNGQILTWSLGDVAVNASGEIFILVKPNCDSSMLGQTLCIEARVTPDSLCGSPFSGPLIEVSGTCLGDSIFFEIQNVGSAMPGPLEFIVIEDNIMLFTQPFQLGAGQNLIVGLPANGSTWRLEALQNPALPAWLGSSSVSATVEGCSVTGSFSTGYVNLFSLNDGSPFFEEECRTVVGSFDPNQKTALPLGYDSEKFIAQNVDLEYQIDFQNTGTDTAFLVVLRDTFDSNLDISRLKMGAASHPFEWKMLGAGVLKITFSNIQLPDSTTNEAASHGFVQFRIPQKRDLPIGTVLTNRAAIFFDFNAPIITNSEAREIAAPMLVEAFEPIDPRAETLRIWPNPASDIVFFEFEKAVGEVVLTLFDAAGRAAFSKKTDSARLEIRHENVLPGVYFLKIETDGKLLGTARLVVF